MTPTDHQLNARLAEVAGVQIHEERIRDRGLGFDHGDVIIWEIGRDDGEWNPIEDANQMAMVHTALRQKGLYHDTYWDKGQEQYRACVESDPQHMVPLTNNWEIGVEECLITHRHFGHDPDEGRARALAIWAMTGGEQHCPAKQAPSRV